MNKWIAEFDLEDGDTMPEHMDLNYMGARIDFHCRPMWIPVSERLPEDSEDVLVWFEYFRYGDYNRMYSTYGIGNYESRFDSWFVNHESGWTNLHIFAWMPMPEPYKAESEVDE